MNALPPELAFDFDKYPYLTSLLAGTGGVIRQEPRDFQVAELPAYLPSGKGEHLYLHIEKTGLTTRQVFEFIRDQLGVPEAGIGVAGLKDKHAVTRQWISIPAKYQHRLAEFDNLSGVKLLETGLHTNKLRTGHLKGNAFRILLRQAEGGAPRAREILGTLEQTGVPNYYGPQRFGLEGQNPLRGYELVRTGKGRANPWLKKFLIASVQSLLFNHWLSLRLERGLFDRVLRGDIAKKHDSGGEFVVEDPDAENPRAKRLEISATGALYGNHYRESEADARALEDEVLARFELGRENFRARRGARRALRFPLGEWGVEESGDGLWVSFFLPKGAYATSLLREIMKKNPEAANLETASLDGLGEAED
ncbi:MAG: tRNA pseudouridine(13) synthase TruD [Deinococcus sp.]|nr:tRNA pseudouridine(13) synthase TruD [Deinococcus sp.]